MQGDGKFSIRTYRDVFPHVKEEKFPFQMALGWLFLAWK